MFLIKLVVDQTEVVDIPPNSLGSTDNENLVFIAASFSEVLFMLCPTSITPSSVAFNMEAVSGNNVLTCNVCFLAHISDMCFDNGRTQTKRCNLNLMTSV